MVIKGSATDETLAQHITNFPSASTLNAGVYQIRVYTSTSATTYYTADVKVTGTSWSMVYPTVAVPDATTTTLAASPAATADTSTPVVLTATVADSTTPATKPTGTVTFKDGATTLKADVAVDAAGQAVYTVAKSTLALGSHSFTAEYTPSGSFTASTSTAVPYSIDLAIPGRRSSVPAPVPLASVSRRPATPAAGPTPATSPTRGSSTPPSRRSRRRRPAAVLPASYVGHKVTCVVTAFNPSGSTVSTSAQVTVAAGAASVATTRARIVGTLLVGKTLTAYRGVWSPAPTSYLYQWKRGSTIVSKTAAYRTTAIDKGKTLVLFVFAVRAGLPHRRLGQPPGEDQVAPTATTSGRSLEVAARSSCYEGGSGRRRQCAAVEDVAAAAAPSR